MKKRESIDEFVRCAAENVQSAIHTRHLDELDIGEELLRCRGAEMVQACCKSVEDVCERTSQTAAYGALIIAYIPLADTPSLNEWEGEDWSEVQAGAEPPSLYSVRGSDLFGLDSEEYRRPVSPPFVINNSVIVLLRCWRSRQARDFDWEFSNGIYLIKDSCS